MSFTPSRGPLLFCCTCAWAVRRHHTPYHHSFNTSSSQLMASTFDQLMASTFDQLMASTFDQEMHALRRLGISTDSLMCLLPSISWLTSHWQKATTKGCTGECQGSCDQGVWACVCASESCGYDLVPMHSYVGESARTAHLDLILDLIP
jgi:hypothetical protein